MLEFPNPEQRAISVSYAKIIADLVELRGGDRNLLLGKAGIDPESMDDFFSFITLAQYKTLLEQAIQITKDPALGLYIGQGLTFGSHGTFAYAALSFPTVWDALKVGRKFSKLCNRIVDISMEEGEAFNVIRIETDRFSGSLYQTVVEIVMGTFCEIFNLKFDGDISSIEIDLRYEKPPYFGEYQKVFKPSLRFESPSNEIRVPKHMADKALAMADPIIAAKFEKECDELIAKLTEPEGTAEQVRQALTMSQDGFPSLDELAARLNMSSRTLRRRLQVEGVCFKRILEEVRLEKAQHYLLASQRSIGDIASVLGYEDQNSFSYAFKVLTGIPPTKFRKEFSQKV